MKQILILSTVLLLVGCVPQQQNTPPTTIVVPNPTPVDPVPPPVTPPAPPMQPSISFLEGYHDGYYGSWLGPFRWVVTEEYRHGWGMGRSDKKNGSEPRYP